MIATTIEQSRRLLEAGVSASTADMCYQNYEFEVEENGDVIHESCRPVGGLHVGNPFNDFPAWSLGALWNLCGDNAIELCTADCTAEEVITILVTRLICAYENGKGDEENYIG